MPCEPRCVRRRARIGQRKDTTDDVGGFPGDSVFESRLFFMTRERIRLELSVSIAIRFDGDTSAFMGGS